MLSSIRIITSCICLFVTTASSFAGGGTFYVATCGSDGWAGIGISCISPLGPKRTIQAAINAAAICSRLALFIRSAVNNSRAAGLVLRLPFV